MTSIEQHDPPSWSLTGIEVAWTDGQKAVLSQSPWSVAVNGWISLVSIPRNEAGQTRFFQVQLRVDPSEKRLALDQEGTWIEARNLIVLRMRARSGSTTDLGEITIR
jgi:hypothetical protein